MSRPEMWKLPAECPTCFHHWDPFGETMYMVPVTKTLVCPECYNTFEQTWYDQETQKQLTLKKLGLSPPNNEIKKAVEDLKSKLELMEKELELEKKKRELFEVQLEQMTMWTENREEDFLLIEHIAQELDEEKKFKEDNK